MPLYDEKKMIEMSLKAIKENELVFVDEITVFVPFCRATFYNHELEKLDTIKDALNENKVKKKFRLRDKWENGDNAVTQLALYRLLSNTEEHEKLNNTTTIKADDSLLERKKQIDKEMTADEAAQIYNEQMKDSE